MKKVLLVCAAGMSTSLLVEKMKKAATEKGVNVEIKAVPIEEVENVYREYDLILLGPQVRHKKSTIEEVVKSHGIHVDVIDPITYGLVDGEKALNQVIKSLGRAN